VRFAPLVVLFFWVPVLAVAVLRTHHIIWLWPPLVFVTVGLLRLAFGQLRASRHGLYRHPPYSETVARRAIQLRQRDVLRSLHRTAPEVVFLTDAGRGPAPGPGAGERGAASRESSLSLTP
jgi:hypothetical protein